MKIHNNVFIVTGGASGLGRATAELLVKDGAKVVILDMNESNGQDAAKAMGSNAIFKQVDITSEEAVKEALESIVAKWSKIDGVINCAGVAYSQKVISRHGVFPLSTFSKILEINVVGTFNVLRLAANIMAKQPPNDNGERGVIINTASVAAFDGQQGQSAYSASKGAIVGMTLPIAREFGPLGIRIVTIAPGVFSTPLMNALPEKAKKQIEATLPFPTRMGRPSEFAQLSKHIIENVMLNGSTIRLDGALRLAKL